MDTDNLNTLPTTVVPLMSVSIDTPIVSECTTTGNIVIASSCQNGSVILGTENGCTIFLEEPYIAVHNLYETPSTTYKPFSTVVADTIKEEVTCSIVEEAIDSIPLASESVAGKVKIGTGINITEEGVISVNSVVTPATQETLGGIIVGDNLVITEEGVLSAVEGSYTLPVASSEVLGGVKIGDGIEINEGVISVPSFTLDVATKDTLGVIKVGDNLTISEDGTLSAIEGSYTLPTASQDVLGGVKIGEYVYMNDKALSVCSTSLFSSCNDLMDAINTIKKLKTCLYEVAQITSSDTMDSFVTKFNTMLDILNGDFDNQQS